ncbi:MAG TPA: malto-oligosyltrehalose trehalohydrolase [Alphaproteobacteria bacterium]|nr:malto-oligosyltrehalose trehalohydrolase [Alphaproteobacteria bacterium]
MTGRFGYDTRWGANRIDEFRTRFRLWAPGAETLSLVCADGEIPMERGAGGWFETVTDRVPLEGTYAFQLPDGRTVPDPAARAQAGDVHGPSRLIDPYNYRWRHSAWDGRPWEDAVIYELHTGTFSDSGTFVGIRERLDHLVALGITAIELMPVAQFGGNRGWGYDGVLPYAPHIAYGGPLGLKALVDAAHEQGLIVLLDVVYNHFGPDGNYLHLYAPDFFDPGRSTPWGSAIAYEREEVRDFFIDNALYWLEEYRFDGLRLDAINEIKDPSPEHLLETMARRIRERIVDREIHLTTEDDRNITRLHERNSAGRPSLFTAEWNDDFHHCAHVIATGEHEGHYVDYFHDPVAKLARALAEGFVYQGEISAFWGQSPRGQPSSHLPPTAFVNFLQNHDQIGNRAFNERLTELTEPRVLEALLAVLLLAPHIPLLFMGEEWGESRPFGYFTDFHGDLANAVREGRRREFSRFASFADERNRLKIADPNAEGTFRASRLDWNGLETEEGRERLALVRRLLEIRRREIVPHLAACASLENATVVVEGRAIGVDWPLGDDAAMALIANFGDQPARCPMNPEGRIVFEAPAGTGADLPAGTLPAWSVLSLIKDQREAG